MTVNEMLSRVRYFIDEKSEKNFTNGDILQSLNAGQDRVQSELMKLEVGYFEKTASIRPDATPPGTIPGVDRYALPDDFLQLVRLEDPDTHKPFIPMNINERSQSAPRDLAASLMFYTPDYGYFISGTDIIFDPTPTTAFEVQLTYVKVLERLSSSTGGTTVIEIPVPWHDLVCISAAIDAKIKDDSSPTSLERLYSREYTRLLTTAGSRQIQAPKEVIRSDSYF